MSKRSDPPKFSWRSLYNNIKINNLNTVEVGVAYVNVRVSRRLKEELAWVIDKRLQDISNKMLFKIVVPLRN